MLGKRAQGEDGEERSAPPPRKKKAKEPNPLSMRKPKKTKEQGGPRKKSKGAAA